MMRICLMYILCLPALAAVTKLRSKGPVVEANAVAQADLSKVLVQRLNNASAPKFATCTQACDRCFDDHYQGCLAFCHTGCEDYCANKLPEPTCKEQQKWTATVGHLLQAFNVSMRMCRTTGLNGCPDPVITPPQQPEPPYPGHQRSGALHYKLL
mmetsp:Transcript_108215/g.170590  ORF Transcript_108215/g.170590 Transcript_108215/m.170590 type:complete len:155 (+) Transcript_108215:87-551(+)